MADLAKGRLREKIPQLEPALEGRMEEHHRDVLRLQLRRMRSLDQDLAELEAQIQEKLKPYRPQLELLIEIPGVDWTLAAVIIAELGVDMKVFQTASQLASWAGVCPGNNESAGRRKSGRVTKGNVHLKTALVEAAQASTRAKGTYNSTASKPGGAPSERWSPSLTRFWWPSTICFRNKSPTTISEICIWTN